MSEPPGPEFKWPALGPDSLGSQLQHLASWDDRVASLLCFSVGVLFFGLLYWTESTFVSLVSYVVLTLLVVSFMHIVLLRKYEPGVQVALFHAPEGRKQFFVERDFETPVKVLVVVLNGAVDAVNRVVSCNDIVLTAQIAVIAAVGAILGRYVPMTLICLTLHVAFFVTLPLRSRFAVGHPPPAASASARHRKSE